MHELNRKPLEQVKPIDLSPLEGAVKALVSDLAWAARLASRDHDDLALIRLHAARVMLAMTREHFEEWFASGQSGDFVNILVKPRPFGVDEVLSTCELCNRAETHDDTCPLGQFDLALQREMGGLR